MCSEVTAKLDMQLQIVLIIHRTCHPLGLVLTLVLDPQNKPADRHSLPAQIRAQHIFVIARKLPHRLLDGQQQSIGVTPYGQMVQMLRRSLSSSIITQGSPADIKGKVTVCRARDEQKVDRAYRSRPFHHS